MLLDSEHVALFDLDSTLADYSKAMIKDYNSLMSEGENSYEDYSKKFYKIC